MAEVIVNGGDCYCCKCTSDCGFCPGGTPVAWSLYVPTLSSVSSGSSGSDECGCSNLAGQVFALKYRGSCVWKSDPFGSSCQAYWHLTTDGVTWTLTGRLYPGDSTIIRYTAPILLFSCGTGGIVGLADAGSCSTLATQNPTLTLTPPAYALDCGGSDSSSSSSSSSSSTSPPVCDCPCCPDGAPQEYTYTVTGLSDDECCLYYNDNPRTLTHISGCIWEDLTSPCFPPEGAGPTVDTLSCVGGFWYLTTNWAVYRADAETWDCAGSNVMDLFSFRCGNAPDTVTVSAVGDVPVLCAPCCNGITYPATLTISVSGGGRLAGDYVMVFECDGCFNPGEVAYTTVTTWNNPDACDETKYPPFGLEVTNYPLPGGGWAAWAMTCQKITGEHFWGLNFYYEEFRFLQCSSHPSYIGVQAKQTSCVPFAIDFGTGEFEGVTYTITVTE